jgi:hypothetical protein
MALILKHLSLFRAATSISLFFSFLSSCALFLNFISKRDGIPLQYSYEDKTTRESIFL